MDKVLVIDCWYRQEDGTISHNVNVLEATWCEKCGDQTYHGPICDVCIETMEDVGPSKSSMGLMLKE